MNFDELLVTWFVEIFKFLLLPVKTQYFSIWNCFHTGEKFCKHTLVNLLFLALNTSVQAYTTCHLTVTTGTVMRHSIIFIV